MSALLARRCWSKRLLWFCRMDSEDISKTHGADLQVKYTFDGLDLVEMRAVFQSLPEVFKNDPGASSHHTHIWNIEASTLHTHVFYCLLMQITFALRGGANGWCGFPRRKETGMARRIYDSTAEHG